MASKWHGWFEAVPVGKALTRDSCHTGTQMALLMSTAISTCECIVTQSATQPYEKAEYANLTLQGFWGFPALLFVVLEMLFTMANRIPLTPGSSGAWGPAQWGLVQQMGLFTLNCSSFLCCTLSGEDIVTSAGAMAMYKCFRWKGQLGWVVICLCWE